MTMFSTPERVELGMRDAPLNASASYAFAVLSPLARSKLLPLDGVLSYLDQLRVATPPDERDVTTTVRESLSMHSAKCVANACNQSPLLAAVFPTDTIDVRPDKNPDSRIEIMTPIAFEKSNDLVPEDATKLYGELRYTTIDDVQLAIEALKKANSISDSAMVAVDLTDHYAQSVNRIGLKIVDMAQQIRSSFSTNTGLLTVLGLRPKFEIDFSVATLRQLQAFVDSLESMLNSYVSNPKDFLVSDILSHVTPRVEDGIKSTVNQQISKIIGRALIRLNNSLVEFRPSIIHSQNDSLKATPKVGMPQKKITIAEPEQVEAPSDELLGEVPTKLRWLPENAKNIVITRRIINGIPVLITEAKHKDARNLENTIVNRNPVEAGAFKQLKDSAIGLYASGGIRNLLRFNSRHESQTEEFTDEKIYYHKTSRPNSPRVYFVCKKADTFMSVDSITQLGIQPDDFILIHIASVNKDKEFDLSSVFMATSIRSRRQSGLRSV